MARISSNRTPFFLRLFCTALALSLFSCPHASADDPDKALNEILSSAESLFKSMKNRDYPAVWNAVTTASKDTIVDDTFKAIARNGGKEIPKAEIRRDFDASGPVARKYWDGFLERFDPDLALSLSLWEKGAIGADRAEILITYKTSEKPALLKLFREDGGWKVGLVESFWGRK